MKRTDFLKKCGMGCLGIMATGWLLESCASSSFIPVSSNNDIFTLPLFHFEKKEQTDYKRYVIVKPDTSKYPIVVYRKSDSVYEALLLRCTHQGAELSVYGDLISCPAHGSEFSNKGEVISGPASKSLQSLPVQINEQELIIRMS